MEVNTASKEELLRVPGIGPKSVLRILAGTPCAEIGYAGAEAHRRGAETRPIFYHLQWPRPAHANRAEIANALLDPKAFSVGVQQLSLDEFVPNALPDAGTCRPPADGPWCGGSGCGPHGARGGLDMPYPAHVSDARLLLRRQLCGVSLLHF